MGYSHTEQHGGVSPKYAEESRLATPEEYAKLKKELEDAGYNLDVTNSITEDKKQRINILLIKQMRLVVIQ